MCWRCGEQVGSLIHIFCSWSKIIDFLKMVRDTICRVTGIEIPLDSRGFLLHLTPFKNRDVHYPSILISAAGDCIPALWWLPDPPTKELWFARVQEICCMEDWTPFAKNQHGKFLGSWTHGYCMNHMGPRRTRWRGVLDGWEVEGDGREHLYFPTHHVLISLVTTFNQSLSFHCVLTSLALAF